jgi:hypothetical protein
MGQREMHTVEQYAAVRQFVFVKGGSRREASRVFGTIKKMCAFSAPPGYVRKAPVRRPKLGAFVTIIDAILAADVTAPAKQRHTAQRIFERLKAEHGYAGGYSAVKEYVREARAQAQETFVPLAHPPGHARRWISAKRSASSAACARRCMCFTWTFRIQTRRS